MQASGSSTDWRVIFPGDSDGLNFFHAAGSVGSFLHLVLPENNSQQSLLLTLEERGLRNVISFGDFQKPFCIFFSSVL